MKDQFISEGCFNGKIRQKKYSFYMPIDKTLVRDFDKRKGDQVYYYKCRTKKGRPVIIAFMDGKNKFGRCGS